MHLDAFHREKVCSDGSQTGEGYFEGDTADVDAVVIRNRCPATSEDMSVAMILGHGSAEFRVDSSAHYHPIETSLEVYSQIFVFEGLVFEDI